MQGISKSAPFADPFGSMQRDQIRYIGGIFILDPFAIDVQCRIIIFSLPT